MTDWFRSWHGAPTDPKWLGIAKHAGVAPGIAVAVAWALMDRASQAADRGSIEGYDADGLACFFGCEPEQVDAIVAAMETKGVVEDGRLTSWEKRQPKREDDSAERVREHRKRKQEQAERDVTHRNAPETEAEKIQKEDADASSTRARQREFDEVFWPAYPRKVGKREALKSFLAARKRADLETIMAGVRCYAAERQGEDPSLTKHPQGWLNGDRWLDEPTPKPPPRGQPPPSKPQSVGQYFQQEARNAGLIDEPGDEISGRVETGDGERQAFGAGGAGVVAIPAGNWRAG